MAKKRPPPGKCVYCLKHSSRMTWDHVFPQAWYPDTTPPDLEKWKVPACLKCNRAFGKLEEDLLWRFGLCLDPDKQISSGISAKVRRAIDPRFAKNDRDRKHREAKRVSILRQLIEYDSVPTEGIFPNFGPQPSLHYDGYGAIPILPDNLISFGQKIVRGVTYIIDNSFIDERFRINIYIVEEHKAGEVLRLIEEHGEIHHRGPGIKVARAVDQGVLSLWLIEIWSRLRMYATVVPVSGTYRRSPL